LSYQRVAGIHQNRPCSLKNERSLKEKKMALEAPFSKHKISTYKIYIVACLLAAAIFAYDGYLSKYKWSRRYDFYKKHVLDKDGKPSSTMIFNQKSPPVFLGAAILLCVYLSLIRNGKIIAGENELVFDAKKRINYETILKIDKTHFDSKGFFIITYKNHSNKEIDLKISDRKYDNLTPLLDQLVAKIS
jgi:hypothetical protein